MPATMTGIRTTKAAIYGDGPLSPPREVWRELTPGHAAPERFDYTRDVDGRPVTLRMRVTRDGQLVCDAVEITAPPDRSLRAGDVDAVPVGRLLALAARDAVRRVSFDAADRDAGPRDALVRIVQRMVRQPDGTVARVADDDAVIVTRDATLEEQEQLDVAELAMMEPEQMAAVVRRHAERSERRRVSEPVPAEQRPRGRVPQREVVAAADAYVTAKRANDPKPIVAVTEALGLFPEQRQTAHRRVNEAKRQGLIPADLT